MKHTYILIMLLTLCCMRGLAQEDVQDDFRSAYDSFRQKARRDYDDFRDKCNKEYAESVRKAWKEHKRLPPVSKPKEDKPVTPVPYNHGNDSRHGNEQQIEEIVKPAPHRDIPQPKPVAPVPEQQADVDDHFSFTFCGTPCSVRLGEAHRFKLRDVSPDAVADIWNTLSRHDYDNTIRDCLALRIEMRLCDWAYLTMLDALAGAFMGKGTDEAVLFMAWLYCQSGYAMKLCSIDGHLDMLFASKHNIFERPRCNIDGDIFYFYNPQSMGRFYVCTATYHNETPMSLLMSGVPQLTKRLSKSRTLQAARYSGTAVQVCVNNNLTDFFSNYPVSTVGGNIMTQWSIYADTPMDETVRQSLYPQLCRFIDGKSKLDAAEILLDFVQSAFEYKTDDEAWGDERIFFAEETLYYPYCDCEDRSILYSRLVRDLLGLDVILVYYPGHLATAVCFNDDSVKGDYIMCDGRRFVISDPTYIGAPVGYTMPGMDNAAAKVVVLE